MLRTESALAHYKTSSFVYSLLATIAYIIAFAGHSLHAGGDNVSQDTDWRLHAFMRSPLGFFMGLWGDGSGGGVEPDATIFPGRNTCSIAGVHLSCAPLSYADMHYFIHEVLCPGRRWGKMPAAALSGLDGVQREGGSGSAPRTRSQQ